MPTTTPQRMAAPTADARPHTSVTLLPDGSPACPECGGRMWDNRADKRNPKAPDFKCRDRACDGRFWPGQVKGAPSAEARDVTEAPATNAAQTAERGPLADTVDAVMQAVGASDVRARARAELRACYLDVTAFVLAEVRPKYAAAGVPCTDATAAAIAATLFIATCNRSAIGGGPDATDAARGGA